MPTRDYRPYAAQQQLLREVGELVSKALPETNWGFGVVLVNFDPEAEGGGVMFASNAATLTGGLGVLLAGVDHAYKNMICDDGKFEVIKTTKASQ